MNPSSHSNRQHWTLIKVLKEATLFLERRGIDSPRLNAERLLGFVLGFSRVDLYVNFEKPLSEKERDAYKRLLRRRGMFEPLQYILGETEFMSLSFKVTPDVLIPRAETEILVEKVIASIDMDDPVRLLEIGLGSGNIAVSLLNNLPDARVTGVEISKSALDLAKENAERNGVIDRICFLQADIREDGFIEKVGPPFDFVVSNPPYVSLSEWNSLPLEIREFEPRHALCDEADGLSFYRIIGRKGTQALKRGGRIIFEVGNQQGSKIRTICHELGYRNISITPDLNGFERVVIGQWNS